MLASAVGVGGGTLSTPVLSLFSFPIKRAIGAGALFNLVISVAGHAVLPDRRSRHAGPDRRCAGRCRVVLRSGAVVACALCRARRGALVGPRAGLGVTPIVRALPRCDRRPPAAADLNWRLGKAAELCLSSSCAGPGVRAQHDIEDVRVRGGIVESIPKQGLPVRGDVHRLRADGSVFRQPSGARHARPHGAGLRAAQARLHHADPGRHHQPGPALRHGHTRGEASGLDSGRRGGRSCSSRRPITSCLCSTPSPWLVAVAGDWFQLLATAGLLALLLLGALLPMFGTARAAPGALERVEAPKWKPITMVTVGIVLLRPAARTHRHVSGAGRAGADRLAGRRGIQDCGSDRQHHRADDPVRSSSSRSGSG